MSFLNWIIEDFNDASDFFYSVYLEVNDWVWPFWLAAEFFYDLSRVFNWLAWDFADFAEWAYDVWDRVLDILDWGDIRSLIRSWLYRIEDVLDWWYRWTTWIGQEIDDWWSSVRLTVQGWIDIATQGFDDLVAAWNDFWNITWPQWVGLFDNLRAEWDNFWTIIFPNLVDFTWLGIWWDTKIADIQWLIDAAFTLRESLWAGWQDWRDSVAEFFADPLQWLYDKMDEFFERFW